MEDLKAAARGEKPAGIWDLPTKAAQYDMAARIAHTAGGLIQPQNVAIGAGAAIAPEIVGPALAAHGAYNAYGPVKKAIETGGEVTPEEAEQGLSSLSEMAGGAAATGGAIKGGLGNTTTAKLGRTCASALNNPFNIGLTGEQRITKGVRPRARATDWPDAIRNPDVQRAIVEQDATSPIKTLEDFKDATPAMKENIWDSKVQPALDRQGPRPVDMAPVAKAIRDAITPTMREFKPDQVAQLEEFASKLERARTVGEASELQKFANTELRTYFGKYPSARRAAFAENLETMGWEIARRETRSQLIKTLEEAGETESAPARKAYGDITTIEKELERKTNVNDRKTTMSLPRILGLMGAGPTGGLSLLAGEVAHRMAQPDYLVRTGIKKLNPPEAAPFTPPAPYQQPVAPISRQLPAVGQSSAPSPIGELPQPGAAEIAHPEMLPQPPIGVEAQRQPLPFRDPTTGEMRPRAFSGEMPPSRCRPNR